MLKLGEGVLADDYDHEITMSRPENIEPQLWNAILRKASSLGFKVPLDQSKFRILKSELIEILNSMEGGKDLELMTLKGVNTKLSPLTIYLQITMLQLPPESKEDRIIKFPGIK